MDEREEEGDEPLCSYCLGSGEGVYAGAACYWCCGSGLDGERERRNADKELAAEARFEQLKDERN